MGLALFRENGQRRSPVYITLVDVSESGKDLSIYFSHMTVRIQGAGLDALAEGLRRQVIPYIQERHVSEFEAKERGKYVDSMKIEGPADEQELGSWAG